jgi:Na+/proline symporter
MGRNRRTLGKCWERSRIKRRPTWTALFRISGNREKRNSASELNALASVTVIDIYKRMIRKNASDRHYVLVSKGATVFWGLYAICFAQFANHLGSLIEAVNILGSLFYGTILGLFCIAFYFKKIGGNATFTAALIAEAVVLSCYFFTAIPYLWFNVIGCLILVVLAHLLNPFLDRGGPARSRIQRQVE